MKSTLPGATRPDKSAERGPRQHALHVVIGDAVLTGIAQQETRAEQEADNDEDAVR